MKIKSFVYIVCCVLCFVASSADFNVRDFGAKGDGAAKDTTGVRLSKRSDGLYMPTGLTLTFY